MLKSGQLLEKKSVVLADIKSLATEFLTEYFKNYLCIPILLYGDIGAGKSTFVKCCLEKLQVLSAEQVFSSPSFTVVNEYEYAQPPNSVHGFLHCPPPIICHVDLYKIQALEQIEHLGVLDIVENSMCFVEWAEKIDHKVNPPYFRIQIEIVSELERNIIIKIHEKE